jgi:hypothetical protein
MLTPMAPTAPMVAALARNFLLEKFDSLMVGWFYIIQFIHSDALQKKAYITQP